MSSVYQQAALWLGYAAEGNLPDVNNNFLEADQPNSCKQADSLTAQHCMPNEPQLARMFLFEFAKMSVCC